MIHSDFITKIERHIIVIIHNYERTFLSPKTQKSRVVDTKKSNIYSELVYRNHPTCVYISIVYCNIMAHIVYNI